MAFEEDLEQGKELLAKLRRLVTPEVSQLLTHPAPPTRKPERKPAARAAAKPESPVVPTEETAVATEPEVEAAAESEVVVPLAPTQSTETTSKAKQRLARQKSEIRQKGPTPPPTNN